MRTSTRTLLRIAFAFALIMGCFALVACSSGSSSSSQAASSAADSSAAASSAATSSAAADDKDSSDKASSGSEAGLAGAFGTAPEIKKEKNPDAVAGTETAPALMPASHESYLSQAELPCQTCHGTDASGNPKNAAAAELPKGHYVNEDPKSGQIDPGRAQCISCHVVDPSK